MHQRTPNMSTCPDLVCFEPRQRKTDMLKTWRSLQGNTIDLPDAGPVSPFWQAAGWQGKGKQAECTSRTLVHAHQQLHPHGDAGVPAQRQQADVTGHNRWAQQVLHRGGAVRVPIEDPVVACLVFVIDPVEGFHGAVLDAVFSNPLISIAATLCEDARHHSHLL